MLLVAGIVDARDHLRHAVALARDLRDDEVVLVVARDREHEIGRAADPGALEHVDLRRVAAHRDRTELGLELLEALALLLDERHLVPACAISERVTFAPTLPPPATIAYVTPYAASAPTALALAGAHGVREDARSRSASGRRCEDRARRRTRRAPGSSTRTTTQSTP